MRRQNRAIERFRRAGAVSEATAVTLSEMGVRRSLATSSLFSRGVLKPAASEGDRYYLDEGEVPNFLRRRLMRVLIVLGVCVVAMIIVLVVR